MLLNVISCEKLWENFRFRNGLKYAVQLAVTWICGCDIFRVIIFRVIVLRYSMSHVGMT